VRRDGEAIEPEGPEIGQIGAPPGDQVRHHATDGGRELESVARHAGGHVEAADRRLVEDRHPVRCDVEGPGVSPLVARLPERRHAAAGPLHDPGDLVEAHVAPERLGIQRMVRLVRVEKAGQREPAGLRAQERPARQVEVDRVGASERRRPLDDEHGVPAHDNGQGHPGQ